MSNDLHVQQKARDVVGLYLKPSKRDPVLCPGGEEPNSALDRSGPFLPSGLVCPTPARDYTAPGNPTLLAAFNILGGGVIGAADFGIEAESL